ncbi:FIG00449901: hypothetical protein [hydrothermal vent metagenome]|uniref:Ancillary SecYEG translocon subunit n=1 Tax=hydrothermal vent metagenome TaxID=652676 RepID=A0A3B0ZNV4_9ZZZZ
MSDEYQTEEEQIEAIKKWWKENGKSIILGLVLGIGGIGGYRFWQSNTAEQAKLASMQFEEVVSLSAKDKDKFISKLKEVESQHSGKSYADLAAFVAVKRLVEEKDYQTAKEQLEWIVTNSKQQSFIHIARIRLVKVLLQMNKPDTALVLIKDIKSAAFGSTYAELRGDIYAALKDFKNAKAAYQLALSKLSPSDRRGSMIEMKSNNLPTSDMPLASITQE